MPQIEFSKWNIIDNKNSFKENEYWKDFKKLSKSISEIQWWKNDFENIINESKFKTNELLTELSLNNEINPEDVKELALFLEQQNSWVINIFSDNILLHKKLKKLQFNLWWGPLFKLNEDFIKWKSGIYSIKTWIVSKNEKS